MSSALQQDIEVCLANILRVMLGRGKNYQVIGDLEDIAQHTMKTWGDNGDRTVAVNEINAGLVSWTPVVETYGSSVFFERCICDAALRLVAACLDGNRVEQSKGRGELWMQVAEWKRYNEAQAEKAKEDYYERMTKERERAYRRGNAADKINQRAYKAANDNSESFVYFITDGEAIKIGKANNPKSRLSGLQTSHHRPLYILALMPGNEALERTLHDRFYNFRIRGEWFKDCDEIRDFIKAVKADSDNQPTAAQAA